MNASHTRLFCAATLAVSLLLSGCGAGDAPASVPISGVGGSGGGGSPSGSTGASAGSVPVMSHNAGQNCMACHVTGGSGAAKGVFTVAGTVVRNDGSAQMRATVVLNVHGTQTAAISLTTDGLGNFWTTQAVPTLVPAAGQQFAIGADVVVTTTAGSRTMAGVITNGSCNSCHGPGGGTGKVTANAAAPTQVSAQAAAGNGESLSAAAPATGEALASSDAPPSDAAATSAAAENVPVPLTIAQIAAGGQHSCVVRTDGVVSCWGTVAGSRAVAAPVAALGSTRISGKDHSIAAGDNHTCAIAQSGDQVLCWGANESGQLGNGSTDPASLSAISLAGVTALSAAGDSTCAQVGKDGQAAIYCWGRLLYYDTKLDRQVSNLVTTPQPVAADAAAGLPDAAVALLHAGARLVDEGSAYNCALLDADTGATQSPGAVQCWGHDAQGRSASNLVVALDTGTPLLAREISLGQNQSCAIDGAGLVKCWGDIEFTHAGTGLVPIRSVASVAGIEAIRFVHIAAGADHSCGITVGNRVKCWGSNDAGQLGLGSDAPHVAVNVAVE